MPSAYDTRVTGIAILIVLAMPAVMTGAAGQPRSEPAQQVTVCALRAHPADYDKKLIEVSGLVSHDFEEFRLSDPECTDGRDVWLEYGGDTGSGTVYCCGPTRRHRDEPLIQDSTFQRFDARIGKRGRVVLRATLVGRFFAGEPDPDALGGFGHFGCCSLLAIQQVTAIDREGVSERASTDGQMYGLIGKMKAVPGQRDALIDILLQSTGSMPGCLSYIVARDQTDPDAIWVTEVWDSRESHQASLKLPAVQAAIAKARPLIAGFGERFETTPAGGYGLSRAK